MKAASSSSPSPPLECVPCVRLVISCRAWRLAAALQQRGGCFEGSCCGDLPYCNHLSRLQRSGLPVFDVLQPTSTLVLWHGQPHKCSALSFPPLLWSTGV